MEFELLGWPPDGPTLRLDYRAVSYAGKFVMSNTGKAVVRDPDRDAEPTEFGEHPSVVAAVAFNDDRTDPDTLWLRYVTVRDEYRGEGIGPNLVEFVVERARDRGYDRVAIAVNNPFAYEALYKAGFEYTGDRTGIAELRLERDLTTTPDPDPGQYRAGLVAFEDRDLTESERTFVDARRRRGPPTVD